MLILIDDLKMFKEKLEQLKIEYQNYKCIRRNVKKIENINRRQEEVTLIKLKNYNDCWIKKVL